MEKQTTFLISCLLIWLTFVVLGFGILARYEFIAGNAANPLLSWPSKTSISKNDHKFSLVIFAHPHCSCSRATIGQLEEMMTTLIDKVEVIVVFVQPANRDLNWMQTDLYEKTQHIPGVNIYIDQNLDQAKIFDAQTSGQVFLYDEKGDLIFSGGITPSRGHMGNNLGRELILKWAIDHDGPRLGKTKVFGCALGEEPITYSTIQASHHHIYEHNK